MVEQGVQDIEPELRAGELSLLKYWLQLRGDRPYPSRRDFVAEDMARWMGWLHLLRPYEDTFQYVIFATNATGHFADRTGSLISEWDGEQKANAAHFYATAFKLACPVYASTPERIGSDDLAYSRLCLPFGEPGEGISHLLCLLTPWKDFESAPHISTRAIQLEKLL